MRERISTRQQPLASEASAEFSKLRVHLRKQDSVVQGKSLFGEFVNALSCGLECRYCVGESGEVEGVVGETLLEFIFEIFVDVPQCGSGVSHVPGDERIVGDMIGQECYVLTHCFVKMETGVCVVGHPVVSVVEGVISVDGILRAGSTSNVELQLLVGGNMRDMVVLPS